MQLCILHPQSAVSARASLGVIGWCLRQETAGCKLLVLGVSPSLGWCLQDWQV